MIKNLKEKKIKLLQLGNIMLKKDEKLLMMYFTNYSNFKKEYKWY